MTWRTHKLQAQNQYDPSGLASPRGSTSRVFMTPPHQSWDATSNYPVTDISVELHCSVPKGPEVPQSLPTS